MTSRRLLLVLSVFLTCVLGTPALAQQIAGNSTYQSFNKAKKVLLENIYYDYTTTFYAESTFNNKKQVFHSGGYKPVKEDKRAYRLEWEHVVPAHAFGQSFPEWRNGSTDCVDSKGKPFKGRKCAEKQSVPFRYMQADMHNLVPAVGELNGLRSNYSFAMIPGEQRRFGTVDVEIEGRKCEPPPKVRGDIARIYFYMESAYPGRGIVSNKNRKLFEAWHHEDPVDDWECERQSRIEKLQGNPNPFVKSYCGAGR